MRATAVLFSFLIHVQAIRKTTGYENCFEINIETLRVTITGGASGLRVCGPFRHFIKPFLFLFMKNNNTLIAVSVNRRISFFVPRVRINVEPSRKSPIDKDKNCNFLKRNKV